MTLQISDRCLWLSLGIFTYAAIRAASHGLRHIRSLTEVHNPPPQPSPRLTEDAIKPSSLSTLATCSNVEIRKAATKILLDRFIAHPSAYKHLVRDAHSKDEGRRHAAYLAFSLLEEYGFVGHSYGVPPPIGAVLGGLVNHRTGVRREWLRANPTRPMRDSRGVDPEERDLRRRRREAMVINEGDRPITQDDVFMRDGEGWMGGDDVVGRAQLNAGLGHAERENLPDWGERLD